MLFYRSYALCVFKMHEEVLIIWVNERKRMRIRISSQQMLKYLGSWLPLKNLFLIPTFYVVSCCNSKFSCDQSVRSEENTDNANSLLITLINQSPEIYGDSLGGLESFSCFLVNRIMEKRQNPPVVTDFRKNPGMIKLIDEHSKRLLLPDLHGLQYNKAFFFHKFTRLSSRSPNNCVVIEDDTVILIQNFLQLFDVLVYHIFLFTLIGFKGNRHTRFVDILSTNECWPLKSVCFKSIKLPVIPKAPSTSCF
ncbi:hypothetical protein GHT06_021591 [Daphnia sinensis]|uniref:Uncharacterized protein n=1 Tax=Daphnia sinensis TaxID=1820382 RepID=A0AAD5PQW9_9CRUS|nr:hypothetical protein GHT06_021591 [Daphnia sinensis]